MRITRRLATSCVRAWTRLYTWHLPAHARDARRADIESDLWESAHDPDGVAGGGLHVLVRLFSGVPDDLGWRLEQENTMTGRAKLGISIAALVAALAVVWVGAAWTLSRHPPPDVRPPVTTAGIGYLPPPPPPPPAPGAASGAATSPSYAQISYTADGARPIKINDVRPVYPPIAITYGLRGTVVIDATVDEAGRIIAARVIRSIPVLDHAAMNAVRRWQFQPTLVDGVPVRVDIRVSATFDQPKPQ